METNLAELQLEAFVTAFNSGFWEFPHPCDAQVATKFALIHSEVSEALEAHRKNQGKRRIGEELCDIIIRTLDLAEGLGINLDEILAVTIPANKERPYKHGGKLY